MANLLPLIAAENEAQAQDTTQLYREIKWDDGRNVPLWRGGNPVWVTGAEAVRSWMMMALHTVRRGTDLFSADYGCELEELVGEPFSEDVRQSEAVRRVRECLLTNPYIKEVQQVSCTFVGSLVTIQCSVVTIYGEVTAKYGS